MKNYLNFIETIDTEIESIKLFRDQLKPAEINKVIKLINSKSGTVVISGIGKSAIIGEKISATLTSTGTKSIFIHSTEAFHGDLGRISKDDIVILLSYSGETDEVVKVLNYCISNSISTISMTGNKNSSIARFSNLHINCAIIKEACSLNLAPTSSTTVTLVAGDAIAVCLMKNKKFGQKDFAKYHPGGSLGKKLLGKVKDYMSSNLPKIYTSNTFMDLLSEITKSGFGICLVFDKNAKDFVGVISDGDIRRYLEKNKTICHTDQIKSLINTKAILISENSNLEYCEKIMNENKVNSLVVENNKKIVGVISRYQIK